MDTSCRALRRIAGGWTGVKLGFPYQNYRRFVCDPGWDVTGSSKRFVRRLGFRLVSFSPYVSGALCSLGQQRFPLLPVEGEGWWRSPRAHGETTEREPRQTWPEVPVSVASRKFQTADRTTKSCLEGPFLCAKPVQG